MARSSASAPARLDGLIEGPVPPADGGEKLLAEWVESAGELGLRFDLRLEGGGFSLLAHDGPLSIPEEEDLQGLVTQALESLLSIFPRELRGRLASTLRSSQEEGGLSRQSIYLITSAGVRVKERKVEVEKRAEPAPRKGYAGWYLVLSAGVLLAAGSSIFFVDYPRLWRELRDRYTPLDPARIELDGREVSRYLTCRTAGVDGSRTLLQVEVRRGERFPLEWAAYRAEEEAAKESGELARFLALQRLVVTGSMRVEYLDRDGNVLGAEERSVRGLRDRETLVLRLPAKEYPGTASVRLTY